MIEREFKLIADADLVLPGLDGVVPGLTVTPTSRLELAATYYDTPTLSLARCGVTLRARTGEAGPIWTLKLPSAARNGGLSRSELTFDEPLGPVPGIARHAVRAYTRAQTLGPVVRLHTDRLESAVHLDGLPLLSLSDDTVVVDEGTEPVRAFREIELELASKEVNRNAVRRILRALRDAGCTDENPVPKAIRALGPRAVEPPDVSVPSIGKHASVGELVRQVIGRSVAQLVDHHAGVWLGGDPEDLHQFRVATRRLRSDLRTIAPLLDQHWTAWLRDELKWLGTEVGRGRDADVLAERLRAQIKGLPAEDHRAAGMLLQRLADNYGEAREHVVSTLSSDRYVALLDALVDASADPRFATDVPGLADQRAREVLVKLVRKPWRKLRTAADGLAADSPDAAFHAVRIRAKRARYAAEAVIPVFGREARRFADSVADVQSVLGDHQDTAVAESWLRSVARDLPSTRLVVGQLVTLERLERLRLRAEFTSAWKIASQRNRSEWMR